MGFHGFPWIAMDSRGIIQVFPTWRECASFYFNRCCYLLCCFLILCEKAQYISDGELCIVERFQGHKRLNSIGLYTSVETEVL